ncbi:hypothetical protein FQA47_012488 [Oryzias melastigma]|uniref:Uncharacterized protein n=1 Tax=Oryzias melastigma TaxID=30732 RepID=A0A834C868_ORYME|nr:hypothetical protein FQA47_012488 [Oryzias melastigma]
MILFSRRHRDDGEHEKLSKKVFQDEHGGNLTAVQDDNGHRENGFEPFCSRTGQRTQSACIERTGCSPLSGSSARTAADAQHQYLEARNSWSSCAPDERTSPGRDVRKRGHAVK